MIGAGKYTQRHQFGLSEINDSDHQQGQISIINHRIWLANYQQRAEIPAGTTSTTASTFATTAPTTAATAPTIITATEGKTRTMDRKCAVILISFLVALFSLVLVILLPMSFSYIEYYEYGLKQQKSTGQVSVDIVYTEGRHTFGPDFDFLIYKADAQFMELKEIDIFTHDKLEYFIRKDELPILHKEFNVYYEDVMRASATDALKGAIPVYSTRELISNRTDVEKHLYQAVRQRLGGICCRQDCNQYASACPVGCKVRTSCTDQDKGLHVDVIHFQLGGVFIPEGIKIRFIEALLLQEKVIRSHLIQESDVLRKETEGMVQAINNEARELKENATTNANLIASIANADKIRITETANVIGLHKLFNNLNITDIEYKTSYNYLRSLQDNDKVHLTVDFDQKIAGNL